MGVTLGCAHHKVKCCLTLGSSVKTLNLESVYPVFTVTSRVELWPFTVKKRSAMTSGTFFFLLFK